MANGEALARTHQDYMLTSVVGEICRSLHQSKMTMADTSNVLFLMLLISCWAVAVSLVDEVTIFVAEITYVGEIDCLKIYVGKKQSHFSCNCNSVYQLSGILFSLH